MAPPVEAFPVSELENRINIQLNGRRRKGGDIDLRKCDLLELVQYECDLKAMEKDGRSIIQCEPVVKLFRRCAGGLMVETTAWDGENNK